MFGLFVPQGSWSKKARCQMLIDIHCNLWCDALVKLSQHDKELGGAFLCYYEKISPYQSYAELRVPFIDITCVCIVHKMGRHNCMALYTSSGTLNSDPIYISFASEKELNDWLTCLSVATSQAQSRKGPVAPNALWATTACGDVFVSEFAGVSNPTDRFWRQIGGHLWTVEAGASGVVWGIGFDGNPYVYTGGYGGGVFSGFSSSSYGLHTQEDYNIHYIYENQRWNPIEGFSDR